MSEKKNITLDDVVSVTFDWKEDPGSVTGEIIEAVNVLLKRRNADFEINIYDDPVIEGSDSYGYILSTDPLTKRTVKKLSKEGWGE